MEFGFDSKESSQFSDTVSKNKLTNPLVYVINNIVNSLSRELN